MKWLAALPQELGKAGLLVAAFASALLGVLAWAALFDHRLDFTGNLAAPSLAVSLFCGLVWLAQREPKRPLSTGPLAVIGVIAWLGFIGPDLAKGLMPRGAAAATGGEPLKVIQFNLWVQDWNSTQARLAWIKKENPDVLLFEEVGPGAAQLLAKLSKDYPYSIYGYASPYAGPVTILSKQRPIAQGRAFGEEGQPNFAWARFHGEASDYAVAVTHFTYPMPDARQQKMAARLAKDLKATGVGDLVLGGDFNAAGWSFPMERLERESGLVRQTHALFTFPARRVTGAKIPWPVPLLPIDHVLTRGAWRTLSVQRGPDLGSDHYPVVISLVRDKKPLRPTVPAAKAANTPVAKNERAPSGTP